MSEGASFVVVVVGVPVVEPLYQFNGEGGGGGERERERDRYRAHPTD